MLPSDVARFLEVFDPQFSFPGMRLHRMSRRSLCAWQWTQRCWMIVAADTADYFATRPRMMIPNLGSHLSRYCSFAGTRVVGCLAMEVRGIRRLLDLLLRLLPTWLLGASRLGANRTTALRYHVGTHVVFSTRNGLIA